MCKMQYSEFIGPPLECFDDKSQVNFATFSALVRSTSTLVYGLLKIMIAREMPVIYNI